MNSHISYLLLSLVLLLFMGCREEGTSEWLIPSDEVFDGGPGKDGIPAVDNPQFIDPAEATMLEPDDLIVGIKVGNETKAYPHRILDWHEIVNDKSTNVPFSVVYCPLTGSATGWSRVLDGKETTFGVSGLLYNTNIIPYDRETDSNWSQMGLKCVNGKLSGKEPDNIMLLETSWETWKTLYPDTKVMSEDTGFGRQYGLYPYGDYRTNNSLFLFPLSNRDGRLPSKERVFAMVINGAAKAFPFSNFENGLQVVEDDVNGIPVVVAGSKSMNYVVGFERVLADGTQLSFSPLLDSGDRIMTDNEGNTWDVFGYAVSGPRMGQRLTTVTGFIAYWFAWGTFFPELSIVQ